jgi:hypothetical protein
VVEGRATAPHAPNHGKTIERIQYIPVRVKLVLREMLNFLPPRLPDKRASGSPSPLHQLGLFREAAAGDKYGSPEQSS